MQADLHEFSDEELEITELPEHEEMLTLKLGPSTAPTFDLNFPIDLLIIKL